MRLKSRHLYYEVCKLSKNFTEGNARKISVVFLHWLLCDVIKSQNDHARMRINGPLASLPTEQHMGILSAHARKKSNFMNSAPFVILNALRAGF